MPLRMRACVYRKFIHFRTHSLCEKTTGHGSGILGKLGEVFMQFRMIAWFGLAAVRQTLIICYNVGL